jgi:hypothetical protein
MLSLDDVEVALESAPIVDLRRAWRAYLENRDEAGRGEVRRLVREMTTLGLPENAAALATGIPPEDITALSREVEQDGGCDGPPTLAVAGRASSGVMGAAR